MEESELLCPMRSLPKTEETYSLPSPMRSLPKTEETYSLHRSYEALQAEKEEGAEEGSSEVEESE